MADDSSILEGCLEGRPEAWRKFVGRFSKLIHWSVRKTLEGTAFGARRDLVEDIFQEVFQKVLDRDRLAGLRESTSLPKFLSVLACHTTLDRVRSLRRYEGRLDFLDAGSSSATDPAVAASAACPPAGRDPAEEAVSKERLEILDGAVAELSPKERACLELHYLDGQSHQEIAGVLGLPADTVSTLIRRTKEKLRQTLQKRGLEP